MMASSLQLESRLLVFVLASVDLLLGVKVFMTIFAMSTVCIIIAVTHFLALAQTLIAIDFNFTGIFEFFNDVLLRFRLFGFSQQNFWFH